MLVGGTGNDTLFGGGGNDTYLFALNDGIDTINEDGGSNGGAGTDLITIMANGAALSSLNFFDTVAGAGGNLVIDYNGQQITVINEFNGDSHFTVENLTFFGGASYLGYDLGSVTYSLNGGASNPIRVGDSADNTLSGGLGRDLIFGNAGNDTITGGGGTDLLVGGAGNDTVTGGIGDDVLVGGTGNDILTGGGGNNRFVFAEAGPANVDTITDHSTKDVIDLSPLLDSQFRPDRQPCGFCPPRAKWLGRRRAGRPGRRGQRPELGRRGRSPRLRNGRTGPGPRPFRQRDLRSDCLNSSGATIRGCARPTAGGLAAQCRLAPGSPTIRAAAIIPISHRKYWSG